MTRRSGPAACLPAGAPGRHLFLTRAMAARLGVALDAALHAGFLSRHDLSRMITRCRACLCPEECAALLDGELREMVEAPAYCRNRAALAPLRGIF